MVTIYTITRDCHVGPGKCTECANRSYKRVLHVITEDKSVVDRTVALWKAYNPRITTREHSPMGVAQ